MKLFGRHHLNLLTYRLNLLVSIAVLTLCTGFGSGARAQSAGDNYFNTSENPVTNQAQSMAASPDQKNYAISNNPHGEHGEALGQETRMTAGGMWPAIVPPAAVQLDYRSAKAVDAVTAATGTKGASGANLLSGNVAATAMAVGWQQATARAQLPESMMPLAKEMQNQSTIQNADNAAGMARNQAACAIDFVKTHLDNFTSDAGNKWNRLRNELFIPIAILLLLPGAVAAQAKAIVAQGFGIFGNVSPFDGIIRGIIAIFLIPGTYLVINYGIDVSNCIGQSIRDAYSNIFHSDMYRDAMAAQIRAFPIRKPSENLNYTPTDGGTGTGFGTFSQGLTGTQQDTLTTLFNETLGIKASAGVDVSIKTPAGSVTVQTPQDPISAVLGGASSTTATILTTLGSQGSAAGANTPFAKMEQRSLGIKLEDPAAGIYDTREGREYERLPYYVHAQRLGYNGANAALTTTWTILCAFQMAYLYYLWFVGPIVAALWVWPMAQLRQALPNWIDGVVTICFWSLFWNTSVLLMACFRGVDDTGTVMMTALNFLSTACVKSAFDFSGLVRAAGAEAAKVAEKATKGGSKSGGGKGGGGSAGVADAAATGKGAGAGSKQSGSGEGQQSAGGQGGDGSSGGSFPGGDSTQTSMMSSFSGSGDASSALGVEHTLPPTSGSGGESGTGANVKAGDTGANDGPISSSLSSPGGDFGVAPPPVGAATGPSDPTSSNYVANGPMSFDGSAANGSGQGTGTDTTATADWAAFSAAASSTSVLADPSAAITAGTTGSYTSDSAMFASSTSNAAAWAATAQTSTNGSVMDPYAAYGQGSVGISAGQAGASAQPPSEGSSASAYAAQPVYSTGSTDNSYAPPPASAPGSAAANYVSPPPYSAVSDPSASAASSIIPPPPAAAATGAVSDAGPTEPNANATALTAASAGFTASSPQAMAAEPSSGAGAPPVHSGALANTSPPAGTAPPASNSSPSPDGSVTSASHQSGNQASYVVPPASSPDTGSGYAAIPPYHSPAIPVPHVAPPVSGHYPAPKESIPTVPQWHGASTAPMQHSYGEPAAYQQAPPPPPSPAPHYTSAPQTHHVPAQQSHYAPAPHAPAPQAAAPQAHQAPSAPPPAPAPAPINQQATSSGLLAALGKAAAPRLQGGGGAPPTASSSSAGKQSKQGSLQDHLKPAGGRNRRKSAENGQEEDELLPWQKTSA